jgi:hypothetical protein
VNDYKIVYWVSEKCYDDPENTETKIFYCTANSDLEAYAQWVLKFADEGCVINETFVKDWTHIIFGVPS